MNLLTPFQALVQSHLTADTSEVVVAYSGGLDSRVLLELTALCRDLPDFPPVRAIHIHHGLSANADAWQVHCQKQCEKLRVPLTSVNVSVDSSAGQGIEAAAREARYNALEELSQDNSLILTGQHQDDQLETVLLQLKRGAGPKGLSGMGSTTDRVRGIRLLRPLIECSREQVLAFATNHKLDWIEDESNQDTRFDRNFLRQVILPQLTERWPELAKTVCRSAQLCAEQQALLDEVAQERLNALTHSGQSLDLLELKTYSLLWQQQLLRLWFRQCGASMPSASVLKEIVKMFDAAQDSEPLVCWHQWQVRRFDNKLYLVSEEQVKPGQNTTWQAQDTIFASPLIPALKMSYEAFLGAVEVRIPQTASSLELRFDQFSTRFKPSGSDLSKPLKQWYKQWRIPPWQRNQVAQLFADNQLCAVVTQDAVLCRSEAELDKYKVLFIAPLAGQ